MPHHAERDGYMVDAPLSPMRPVFRDILFTSLAAEEAGVELIGMTVQMDLPELGLTGEANVTDIQGCPQIEAKADSSDDRRVVTATFHHSSGDVIDLTLADGVDVSKSQAPIPTSLNPETLTPKPVGEAESIGTTSNHPFWSVDRQEYVQAGQLEIGERLQTLHGDTKTVVSNLPRPGPKTDVYNLEVHAEHVYFVGEDGVLVHNAGPTYGGGRKRVAHKPLQSGDVDQYAFFNRKSRVGDGLEGHELWQNANNVAKFKTGGGRSGRFGKRNPAIALSEADHVTVNGIQNALIPNAKALSPLDNIRVNIRVLREARRQGVNVTDHQINDLARRAVRFHARMLRDGKLK